MDQDGATRREVLQVGAAALALSGIAADQAFAYFMARNA